MGQRILHDAALQVLWPTGVEVQHGVKNILHHQDQRGGGIAIGHRLDHPQRRRQIGALAAQSPGRGQGQPAGRMQGLKFSNGKLASRSC